LSIVFARPLIKRTHCTSAVMCSRDRRK
jgi:hypothetical protein